jgi:hypothetical protein
MRDETTADDAGQTPSEGPRRIDKGTPSFADTNIAADQRRQGRERGEGLGAGGSDNRDARYDADDRSRGDVPEDDLD